MSAAEAGKPANPMGAFYEFVKAHLTVVNNVMASSAALVALLDFFAPRLSLLPKLVYSATGLALLLMLFAATAPATLARVFSAMGLSSPRTGGVALWRRPVWQFAVAILLGVTTLGFVSVAKASQGGIIAGSLPDARRWQESILSLQAESGAIRNGVDSANAKLDRIVGAVDPDNAADRCPDLACAVGDGASAKAVGRLFERGAKLPDSPALLGDLAKRAIISASADRLDTIDLLIKHGLDPNLMINANATGATDISSAQAKLAQEAFAAAGLERNGTLRFVLAPSGSKAVDEWNALNLCVARTTKGVALIEFAAMRGDRALYQHLTDRGASMPSRPLACVWSTAGQTGAARIDFRDGAALVAADARNKVSASAPDPAGARGASDF